MKYFLVLIAICLLQASITGCSHLPMYKWDTFSGPDVESAIKQNDLKKVKSAVSYRSLDGYGGYHNVLTERKYTGSDYGCRNVEIAEFLIEHGAQPVERISNALEGFKDRKYAKLPYSTTTSYEPPLQSAIAQGCDELVSSYIKMMSPEDIALGTNTLNLGNHEARVRDESAGQRVVRLVNLLKERNTTLCKDDHIGNCEAAAHIDRQLAGVKEREMNRIFALSPDGTKAAACQVLTERAVHQSAIDRERQIATVSDGVSDLRVRHYNASSIVELDQKLEAFKEKYKAQTGETLNLSNCK